MRPKRPTHTDCRIEVNAIASCRRRDYRISRKGVFVNPLGVTFQPSVPLRPEYQLAFEAKKQEWQSQLARLDFASPQQTIVMNLTAPFDDAATKEKLR